MKSTAILLLASLVTSNEAFIPANGPQVPRNQAITRVRASVDEDPGGINSRREVLSSVAGGILTLGMPVLANALDMDAFANSQVSFLHV